MYPYTQDSEEYLRYTSDTKLAWIFNFNENNAQLQFRIYNYKTLKQISIYWLQEQEENIPQAHSRPNLVTLTGRKVTARNWFIIDKIILPRKY